MVLEHDSSATLVSSHGPLLTENEDVELFGCFDRRQTTLFDALGDESNLSEALGTHAGRTT